MRLLNTSPFLPGQDLLEFVERYGDRIPPYAIVSHKWGKDEDEVYLTDILHGTARAKKGFTKLASALDRARLDGLGYLWMDTCCIDKTSSAEMSEAINSMYEWYYNAKKCYAYLVDVSVDQPTDGNLEAYELLRVLRSFRQAELSELYCRVDLAAEYLPDASEFNRQFHQSEWFERGWTLQELLAPRELEFFNRDWKHIGDRVRHQELISKRTNIDVDYLTGVRSTEQASIATRMSWAASRKTTRKEDKAYCLMGLFLVSMPMLYGEGDRAFIRLQEEIMRHSDDQSLFAWATPSEAPDSKSSNVKAARSTVAENVKHGLLADSPKAFADSHSVIPWSNIKEQSPFVMTNLGLSIDLRLTKLEGNQYAAALECHQTFQHDKFLAVYLEKLDTGPDQYARVACSRLGAGRLIDKGPLQHIHIRQSFPSQPTQAQFFQLGRLTTEPLITGKSYRVVDVKSRYISERDRVSLPNETAQSRFWSPSGFPTVFQIPSGSSELAVAQLFQRSSDGEAFWLMLGSMPEFELGFTVVQPGGSMSFHPANIATYRFDETVPMPDADDVVSFSKAFSRDLLPPGHIMSLGCHDVLVSVKSHVDHGRKIHMVDVKIVPKPKKSEPANVSHEIVTKVNESPIVRKHRNFLGSKARSKR